MGLTGREIRSKIDDSGTLTISIEMVDVPDPGDDEVVVRIEATPINPTDLGLLLGPAAMESLVASGTPDNPVLTLTVPPAWLTGEKARIGKSICVGIEGAGTVVAAGRNAIGLEGKPVSLFGGGIYADYRRIRSRDVVLLPDGTSAADGASMFVNPLTALGMVETARSEGHKAIVHTAAASNLGRMLQKICLADNIPLINIVRSQEQVKTLQAIGAKHVANSKDENFGDQLYEMIEQTGATIAFDAIGGGTLGSQILEAMERAEVARMTEYSLYGSDVLKQLYIYGTLDIEPTTLDRLAFGFRWGVAGWLLFPFLRKAGEATGDRLRKRIVDELTTTFASHYTRTIGLAELLQPDILHSCTRMATGEKLLIDPTRDREYAPGQVGRRN